MFLEVWRFWFGLIYRQIRYFVVGFWMRVKINVFF